MAVEALGVASSVIAIVDMSFKIIHIVGRYMSGVKGAKDDMRNLIAELTECHTAADEMDKLLKDPKAHALLSSRELASTLDPARVTLKNLQTRLEASSSSSLGSLKWPLQKGSIEDTIKLLSRARKTMVAMLTMDQTRLGLNIEHQIVINNLPIAEGAAFDSHAQEHSTACLPDTRVELLQEVAQWIESPDSKAIFWLNGMAGTGKSTISQSVALSQSAAGQLGATFFFKKGESDRSNLTRFMSTLARQLAHHVPGVGALIKDAVDKDPTIGGKLIQQQFDKLIVEPLASFLANATSPERIVFVIDALDECEKDEDIRLLIRVITSAANLRSHLRFFLTSRPNLPVRLGFKKAKDAYQDLVLHEMPEIIVEHDLAVFFRVKLNSIRLDFNTIVDNDSDKILDDWPGDDTLRELVSRSKPLFIFAATLCRFVNDPNCGNPKALLAKFLESEATGSHLSQTYGPILDSQLVDIPPRLRAGIIKDFVLVVGSIVILAEPLGISSLASLLNESRDTVSDRLRLLHSVLRIPQDDSPVRLLHLSFGDYLLDPGTQTEGAHQFCVDKDDAHRTVAERSIRLMREHPLRQNIADLSFPGMKASDVNPQQLANAILPALRYACRYWVYHLTSSQFHEIHGDLVHNFLKVHLLHWCEAMSLLGHLGEAMNALRSLLSWIQPSNSLSEMSDLLTDAMRFLRSNFYVMERTPLQIYSSALALSPANSIVKRSFASCIPSWLTLQPPVRKSWNACLAVLECKGGLVSVAFSRDSKRLAGASYSGVRVWDVDTGECKATLLLALHDSEEFLPIGAVAFSHDSELVAASYGSTIGVWMVQTGQCLLHLEGCRKKTSKKGHSPARNLFFTSDSKSLFSDANMGDIRLWDLTSGTCTVVLASLDDFRHRFVNCHIQDLTPLVLSRNGTVCRIWNITQFGPTAQAPGLGVRLEGSIPPERAVAASHKHARIVISSWGTTICCWDAKTGRLLNKLPADGARWVSVTFCGHSQKLIAAASEEGQVCFWNVDTGQVSKKLIRHDIITRGHQLVCSPDGGFLATYRDATILDLNELRHQDAPKRPKYPRNFHSLVFCHEARVLASSSNDGSIHVWDAENGNAEEISKGHPLPRVLDKFRPGSTTFGHLWELLGKSQGRICIPEEIIVSAVKFSNNSENFATASYGEGPLRIQLWNARSQKKMQTMQICGSPQHSVRAMFLSEDSTRLAAIIQEHLPSHTQDHMMVWDCLSGVCMHDILHEKNSINSAIFLSSGKKLVSAVNYSIRVWDLETGEEQFLPPPKEKDPGVSRHVALAASSDSTRLVSATTLNEIWIWNLETGHCIAILTTSTRLFEISFLPGDGELATSAGIIPIDINAAGPFHFKAEFKGLGYCDEGWITWDGRPWLWLPRQYRRNTHFGRSLVQGNKVAITCESGEVVFFGIDGSMGFEHGTSV